MTGLSPSDFANKLPDYVAVGDIVKFYIDGELVIDYHHNQLINHRSGNLRTKKWEQGRFGVRIRGPGIGIHRVRVWTVHRESKPPSGDVKNPTAFENAAFKARKQAMVCDTIFAAMNHLLATRPEYLVEKNITPEHRALDPEAWFSFANAIRSNQFLRTYNRSESYEVNERVYRREGQLFARLVMDRINQQSSEPVGIGDYEFCQGLDRIWGEWVSRPLPGKRFAGSTTSAVVKGLEIIDRAIAK